MGYRYWGGGEYVPYRTKKVDNKIIFEKLTIRIRCARFHFPVTLLPFPDPDLGKLNADPC